MKYMVIYQSLEETFVSILDKSWIWNSIFKRYDPMLSEKHQSTAWVILSSINMYQNTQQQLSGANDRGFIVYMSQKISEKLHFLCKIYKDTAGVESSTIIYIERILVLCVIDKNTNWINGFEHLSCVPCHVVICVHQYFAENNIR